MYIIYYSPQCSVPIGEKGPRCTSIVELMLALTEYNYFKPAACVLAEGVTLRPLVMGEIIKCTSGVLS